MDRAQMPCVVVVLDHTADNREDGTDHLQDPVQMGATATAMLAEPGVGVVKRQHAFGHQELVLFE